MKSFLRRHLKKLLYLLGIFCFIVLLLYLFPPSIHGKIAKIRKMQKQATSPFVDFVFDQRENQLPELDEDATYEEEIVYQRRKYTPHAYYPFSFDANQYLKVLNKLKMEDDYVIDYLYQATFSGGHPVLYARRKGDAKIENPKDGYSRKFGRISDSYIERVKTDDSKEGFIQLATLYLIGGQFYQFWHSNYNDLKIISRIPPQTEFSENEVTVTLVTFTKWGGYYLRKIKFNRLFPHKILSEERKQLISYSCGITF